MNLQRRNVGLANIDIDYRRRVNAWGSQGVRMVEKKILQPWRFR